MKPMKRVGINVGGGYVAGINAVIAGTVLPGHELGWDVMGVRDGFDGLLFPERYPEGGLLTLTPQIVENFSAGGSLPVVYQENVIGTSSQSGLSDTLQSLFFSPKAPTRGGWIGGAGPVFLLPTATDDLLGAEKWGAGPTAVVLKQEKGWTYGALANHLWSFAGESGRQDVNATFLQPFLAYTTKKQTTFTLNTETTYDWENEQWTVPLNLMVAQLVKIGRLPVQFEVGGRYYAEHADNGPEWGLRFSMIFLFPK